MIDNWRDDLKMFSLPCEQIKSMVKFSHVQEFHQIEFLHKQQNTIIVQLFIYFFHNVEEVAAAFHFRKIPIMVQMQDMVIYFVIFSHQGVKGTLKRRKSNEVSACFAAKWWYNGLETT